MKEFIRASVEIMLGHGEEPSKLNKLKEKALRLKIRIPLTKVSTLGRHKTKLFTPLYAAAECGYLSIAQYLIEELVVNPDEVVSRERKTTAIDIAIQQNHIEVAEYIASKATSFVKDKNGSCDTLVLAIQKDMHTVVAAMLTADKSLFTSMHHDRRLIDLVIRNIATKCAELIVPMYTTEALEKPNQLGVSAYQFSLKCPDPAILRTLLHKSNINPLYSKMGEIRIPNLILVSSIKELNNKAKISLLDLLLECGAGLDITKVSKKVLALLDVTNLSITNETILLRYHQKNDKNQWEKKFATSISDLRRLIDHPDCRFNKVLLLRTVLMNPEIHAAKEIQEILCTNNENIIEKVKINEKPTSVEILSNAKKPMSELTATDLFKNFFFELEKYKAAYVDLITINSRNYSIENRNALIETYQRCITHLSMIFKLYHYLPHGGKESILSIMPNELEKFASSLTRLAVSFSASDDYQLMLFCKLNQDLTKFLDKHNKLASKIFCGYEDLQNLNAWLLHNLSLHYFSENNLPLALQTAEDALYYPKQLTAEKRLHLLFVCVAAHTKEQAFNKANLALEQAMPLFSLNADVTKIYMAFDNIILNIKSNQNFCQEKLVILDELLHIINEYQLSMPVYLMQTKEEFTTIYLNEVKDKLTKKLQTVGFELKQTTHDTLEGYFDLNKMPAIMQGNVLRYLYQTPMIKYMPESNDIMILKEFMLEKNALSWADQLLNLIAKAQADEKERIEFEQRQMKTITNSINNLTIAPQLKKIKIKTRPDSTSDESNSNNSSGSYSSNSSGSYSYSYSYSSNYSSQEKSDLSDSSEENYGLPKLEGYSGAIPVINSGTNTPTKYYVMIPTNDPQFTPFHKFINDKEIKRVKEKGLGQQGGKIGIKTKKINHQPTEVEFIRLKILGANGNGKLRAKGNGQQYKDKTVFVINKVETHKKEERKGYNCK